MHCDMLHMLLSPTAGLLEQASKAFTFRRGTYPAAIQCLSFSGPGVDPPLLCAASGNGTIHIFRLEEQDR